MGGIGMNSEFKGKEESRDRISLNKVQANLIVQPTETEEQNVITQN